jgi:hypothetical protein
MALRGSFSQSFLRSKELLAYSEISYDKEGNYVLDNAILKEALARNNEGKLIRNKVNIAKILNKYGVIYRMVFNAMNMDTYTYHEVQKSLDHLSWYINDLGVSGIVEFHAADKTQNSDHIHFWISSEDKIIYNKIAQEMVTMGYSNKEDVYIQKYENNEKLEESIYVNNDNISINQRFLTIPIKIDSTTITSHPNHLSTLLQQYHTVLNTIDTLFQDKKTKEFDKNPKFFSQKTSIIKNCTLPKNEIITTILSRINTLIEKRRK